MSGQPDVLVRFARCCAPLPGDEVIGFVTRGRGVTVHQKDCAKTFELDPARRIDVQWDTDATAPWSIRVRVHSLDRPGLLAKVTKTISAAGINIGAAQISTHRGRQGDPDLRPVGERRRDPERGDEGDRADQGDPVRRTPPHVMPPVSACVIARDDALQIERCLASLAWTDEIVVVIDERSRDGTEELARRAGARVLRHAYPGNVEQKNFALDQAKHDWVVALDADEALSPALAARLRERLRRRSVRARAASS